MSDAVRQFFASLPSRVGPGQTAGIDNAYVFEVDGAGTWTVRVNDDGVAVEEGDAGGDCTIRTSAETFERLASRQQNPATAYMTGKLKVEGDLGAALKLQKLF